MVCPDEEVESRRGTIACHLRRALAPLCGAKAVCSLQEHEPVLAVRQLFFICLIRGAHFFAPYRRLSRPGGRPPPPGEPEHPLLRDDPDQVRQVTAALPAPLFNGQEPKPGCLSDRVLNHSATHPSPRRKLIDASITVTVLADLVPDDPQHRQLTDRELAGQRR